MITYENVNVGSTYICKYEHLVSDCIFELTILKFSDSRKYFKYSNINGELFWGKCEDYKIVDKVTDISV